jgi:uncharacterized protein (TIGR03437 family)
LLQQSGCELYEAGLCSLEKTDGESILMRKRSLSLAFLTLVLTTFLGSVSALQAQYVATFEGGANTSDPTVSVYESSTFSNVASFSVPGAFQLLSLANGTKHYFVCNVPGAGITAVDSLFSNAYQVGNLQIALDAAALSPDGSRLVVATAPVGVSGGNSSVVYIFDTASDVSLTPQGLSVVTAVSADVVDVAVSYDSQTAYALGNMGAGKGYLAAINLQQNKVTTTVNLDQTANGLAIGPNGLLYVSEQNKILEINPAGLIITSVGAIDVDANPSRVTFTPNGRYALAPNRTLSTGSAAVLIDLATHTVAGSVPSTGLGATFDKLMPASSNVIYAWSNGAQSLYTMQIGLTGGLILTAPTVPGVNLMGVSAAGLSNDLGVPARNDPQFLFVVSGGVLYRIDPATSTMSQQVALSSNPGDLAFFSPTATGNSPVTVLLYGTNQSVSPGGTSFPFVARFLDANGLPISGVPVDFSVSSGTVNPVNAATGADGYVQTIFTGGTTPADIGAFGISVGSSGASFIVNVGTATSTSPSAPATMNIVSGQGQIALTDPITGALVNTLAPLTVQVNDANGMPVPNALVTFTWTAGYGMGFVSSGYGVGPGQTAIVTPTDITGQATTSFVPPPIIGTNPPFATSTITASVAGINSSNFYMTEMAEQGGLCGNLSTCPLAVPFTAYLVQPSSRGVTLTGSAGSTLPGAIQIAVDTFSGAPISNLGLQVYTGTDPTVSSATCADPADGGVALTGTNGVATCDLFLNGAAGTSLPLTISVGGLVTFPGTTLTVTPGPPTQVNIVAGNNQVGTLGTSLPTPFEVQVADSFKNPLPAVPVNWQVASGSMTLTKVSTTTDSQGLAYATGIPTESGNITIVATAGSGSASFMALATVAAAAITISSGNSQSAQVNLPFAAPLVVQVSDVNGNPAAFAGVSFAVSSGSAVLSAASVAADATGLASITVIAGPTSGPVSIVATSGNASATFSLTVLPIGPSSVSIVNAASFNADISPGGLATIMGTSLTPTVQGVITDTSQMAGYSVTFGGITAPILALVNQNGTQEINIQVPFEVQAGPNTVVIQTPQGSVTLNNVVVSPLAPGIFTSGTTSAGSPLAVALRPDGSTVTPANPVQRGENITLFATGLGLTIPLPSTNVPGVPGQVVASTVYAAVNNSGVTVVSAVYQPGLNGVYAVTIQIPLATMAGPTQAVSLALVDSSGTAYGSPAAYLPIQ